MIESGLRHFEDTKADTKVTCSLGGKTLSIKDTPNHDYYAFLLMHFQSLNRVHITAIPKCPLFRESAVTKCNKVNIQLNSCFVFV